MNSDLHTYIDLLCLHINGWSPPPLHKGRILIVEDTDVTHGAVMEIPRRAIYTPASYSGRFKTKLNEGYSWINMNAAGILDEGLLIIMEYPREANPDYQGKVSVNYSGPNMNRWNAAEHIKIIG